MAGRFSHPPPARDTITTHMVMSAPSPSPLIALNSYEGRLAEAVFDQLFPAGSSWPAASAMGVVDYLDRALAGPYHELAETYRVGLAAIDKAARVQYGAPFASCAPGQQAELLGGLERGSLAGMLAPAPDEFFRLLRLHLQEGLFADPAY